MAVKKSELYSSLWASCDALRGGMDSMEYKNYILTLLFVKYVSDKYDDSPIGAITIPPGASFKDMVQLRGNKHIGEEMDKKISTLAEENGLCGVIDNAKFNDSEKFGAGQEMVETLSRLLGIFNDNIPNLNKNRVDGDDIIGDAYEYLMRNFASERIKKGGEFYTPSEVSRILAQVIDIEKETDKQATLYDPACGSGSLLIRAAECAPFIISIWGQEKTQATAGLARMNTVLHNMPTADIKSGNTFSAPKHLKDNDTQLMQFKYIVANPPFSDKEWTLGLNEFGRFDEFNTKPPPKNGDYAWLLHILKSLKHNGKAAVILPHGVLFRGNAEAIIRRGIIEAGYIKGIIGLPSNLFYGTGIPACIIVIDKERCTKNIFMIDAAKDFIKDGNKNRLRERDIYKIVSTFKNQIEIENYSRLIPIEEIKKNDFNLNIPRYINNGKKEDLQNIEAHLKGGIPLADIDCLNEYWQAFPTLKKQIFSACKPNRKEFVQLMIDKDSIYEIISTDGDFIKYIMEIKHAFEKWLDSVDTKLKIIDSQTRPKALIKEIAQQIIDEFTSITLIDKYAVYEVLLSYWNTVMVDDVYLIVDEGYDVIKEIETISKNIWEGKLIPKSLIIEMFFEKEQNDVNLMEKDINSLQAEIEEITENADEDSLISEILNDKGNIDKRALFEKIDEIQSYIINEEIEALQSLLMSSLPSKKNVENFIKANPLCQNAVSDKGTINKISIKSRIADIRENLAPPDIYKEDYDVLRNLEQIVIQIDTQNILLKQMKKDLDKMTFEKYPTLTRDECLELLLNRKWYRSIWHGINDTYKSVSHFITERIHELAERYEDTLPKLEAEVAELENKVKEHLENMGYKW